MQKPKPLPILIFCALFLIPMLYILNYLGSKVTADQLPPWTFEHRLLDWQERWQAYQDSPETPQTVIVGQSYAEQLGDIGNIQNLGFPGGNPRMCERIIQKARPQDTVFFIITARDIVFQRVDVPIEFEIAFFANRKANQASLGLIEPKPEEKKEKQRDRLVRLWLSMSHDVSFYKSIHDKHPNVRFILFPCCPAKLGVSEKDAQRMAFNNRVIATLFKQSDIPITDLSRALEPADFKDFLHANKRGKEKLRAILAGL